MTHSKECCTPLAWELLLQEIPHSLPLRQVQWSACTWISISTACPGSFLLSPLPGDPEAVGRCLEDPVASQSHEANRCKASAGCQPLPRDAGGSAPVLHLTLSLWLPGTEPEEVQGRVTSIPFPWPWFSLTSVQPQEGTMLHFTNCWIFSSCISLPCNLNLTAAV